MTSGLVSDDAGFLEDMVRKQVCDPKALRLQIDSHLSEEQNRGISPWLGVPLGGLASSATFMVPILMA